MDLMIVFIAVGLSADALAVSIAKCLVDKKFILQKALVLSLSFGFFQGAMLLSGWFLGLQVMDLVAGIDHWVAFALLCLIGGKMIGESKALERDKEKLDGKTLLMLSIATSIDALAVGLTISFLKADIFEVAVLVGVLTFLISLTGCYLGRKIGGRIGKNAEVVGGIILIAIGVKILLEHLGFL